MEETTHTVFTVMPALHEQDPERSMWRVRHADATVRVCLAYFERVNGPQSEIAKTALGNYRVHVPVNASSVVSVVRSMLERHEGMEIISENEEPGLGIITAVRG
jgi:hypothetical protein